jgi:hypothetical protein
MSEYLENTSNSYINDYSKFDYSNSENKDGSLVFDETIKRINVSLIQEPEFMSINRYVNNKKIFTNNLNKYIEFIKKLKDEKEYKYYEIPFKWDSYYLDEFKRDAEIINDIFDIVKEYSKGNEIMINKELDLNKSDIIEIYCYNSFRVANEITNLLFKKKYKTVVLKTIVEHEEFLIENLTRNVIHIFSVIPSENKDKKGLKLRTVSNTIKDDIMYYPQELKIIDYYSDIMNVVQYPEFQDVINIYKNNIKVLEKNSHKEPVDEKPDMQINKIMGKEGGVKINDFGLSDYYISKTPIASSFMDLGSSLLEKKGGNVCDDKKKDLIFQMKYTILEKMMNNDKYVLLGSWAYYVKKYGMELPCIIEDRIQIASIYHFNKLFSKIKNIIKSIYGYDVKEGTKHFMKIPKEYRLTNTSIKIIIPGKMIHKEHILIEYVNILEYQALPCYKNELFIFLGKNMLLRLLFIELWILFTVYSNHILSFEKYKLLINRNIELINNINNEFSNINCILGIEIPIDEDKKTKSLSKNHWILPYIPQTYKKGESLRII